MVEKEKDIVERLRCGDLPDWKTLVDLAAEAADEIERLRASKAIRDMVAEAQKLRLP
jgi:hypothetical protein